MVVSPSGSGAVRPKRKRRGRKVARVISVEIPMAARNGKALEWSECGLCFGFDRCIRCNKNEEIEGIEHLIIPTLKKQGHAGPVVVLLRTLACC